ncbi:MAG: DNA primase [Epulopiscium sp.]|nr:DNA primase [Candidatus Epulonipiscium sp.]
MENLKQQKIWVLWKMENINRSPSKVLYSTDGRRCGTNEKYKNKWVDYKAAISALEQGNFNGVGFVIPRGLVVIDLDNMKQVDPFAKEILSLTNSYAESSPSGNGLHIIAYVDTDKVPQNKSKLDSKYYCKNSHNGMEIYFGGLTNRYMTFTGDTINTLDVIDITDKIIGLLETYMKRSLFKTSKQNEQIVIDPQGILTIARRAKNGEKFSRLFDKGDISGYGSQSEADQALCNILAFYMGGDFEKIDELFQKSKLYREKWDREDYKEATITNAINCCNGHFFRTLPEYIYFDKAYKVSPPLLAKHIRENLDYIFVKDSATGGILRYVYEDGCYRLYTSEMLKGVIKSYITSFDEGILRMGDVNEVYQNLTTDLVFKTHDELNPDEDIINFENCILRLSDMETLPHSPDILSTIQIPCNWTDSKEPTPIFDNFISTLTNGDKEIENLLLEFIGVAISNVKGHRMKKTLFMVGAGDTGKSQLKSLTEKLLGKGNFTSTDLKEIEARFGTANIYNKRLAGSSDMSFLTVNELSTLKKLTGGDSVFAEFKGQNGFEFIYEGLLWFCMNKLPKFSGDDGEWVYNRIIQINCNNVIPLEKQDKLLLDKMYAERNGIVYKAIMALKNVISNGYFFTEPDSVIASRKSYMAENNTVITFFNECMEERPDLKIKDNCTTGKVYDVYKAWCSDNNHGYSKTAKEFREDLSNYLKTPHSDLITRRGKGGNFYIKYTLSDETKENYRRAYGYDDFTLFA